MNRNMRHETQQSITSPEESNVGLQSVNLTVMLPSEGPEQSGTSVIAAGAPQYGSGLDQMAYVQSDADDIPPPKADFSAPPPYEVAMKLPTYEEVQREKTLAGEPTPGQHHTRVPLAFLAIDTEAADRDHESGLLGTDFMFFTSFLVAFLFNWIGFLLLMCFCHTVAARYGALSGFGLSLAKWTLIVKHSTDLASRENSWLWWLIMAFGTVWWEPQRRYVEGQVIRGVKEAVEEENKAFRRSSK
uniref:Uncharacterized protein n=1 Tax=Timema genevievae TaxID=629358 RepID=A0A7R9JXW9_TIMGE|nr:unnamed protein product [Timema genevievae]